jgi:hypothetical protein
MVAGWTRVSGPQLGAEVIALAPARRWERRSVEVLTPIEFEIIMSHSADQAA